MALEFLVNPRGAPRARARVAFSAQVGAVAFQGQTEDIGPLGCQLTAPGHVAHGSAISLLLRADPAAEPVPMLGAVAWASPRAPWRLGVAFAEGSRPAATRLFDGLVAGQPGLAGWRQVPDRISLDAMVWLAPPPRLVVDFNADEVAVLTAIATGATVFELKSRLRGRWAQAERAFFSLLASRHVTLSRGGAVPFANWASLLRELQAEVAAAALDDPSPSPPPPPPRAAPSGPPGPRGAPARGPTNDGSNGLDLDPGSLELDLGPGRAGQAGSAPGGGRRRSHDAEEAFQQALQERAAGRDVAAAALLRRAMALAPGDPEIARKLGEVVTGRG
jgi:hypothetical protein